MLNESTVEDEELSFYSMNLLFDKVLLGPNNRPWAADPYPGDGLRCCKVVMLHHVAGNQSARTPQTS